MDAGPLTTFSTTYPRDYRITEIARAAQTAFGHGGTTRLTQKGASLEDNVVNTQSDFYDQIGFRPKIDIESGMKLIAAHRRAKK